jgi:protein SCO1/2
MQFRRLPILIVIVVVTALLIVALVAQRLQRRSDERTYALSGQVQSITPDRNEAMVKHGEIKGLMPAMTMPYRFKAKSDLDGLKPGDLIDGTLVIVSNDAYLTGVKKTGEAPIEKPPPESLVTGQNLDRARQLLQPGDTIPDGDFVDQSGRKVTLSAFRGSTVVLTFIYTRCPLPTFCPMMDRHFVAIQERMRDDPLLKKVHLVTITFDPAYDTPAVLKKHARELNADLNRWTFLTGEPEAIEKFGGRFGVFVTRTRTISATSRTTCARRSSARRRREEDLHRQRVTPEDILTDLKPSANAD